MYVHLWHLLYFGIHVGGFILITSTFDLSKRWFLQFNVGAMLLDQHINQTVANGI